MLYNGAISHSAIYCCQYTGNNSNRNVKGAVNWLPKSLTDTNPLSWISLYNMCNLEYTNVFSFKCVLNSH